MDKCAAVGLQIDDFVVRQKRQCATHGIARANHLSAKLGLGQFFARQQQMVGNAVQNQCVHAEEFGIVTLFQNKR